MKKHLKLTLLHTYYQFLEHIRQPMYLLSTLVFPAMFFWFFGVPNAQTEAAAAMLTGSFACFGVLGVVLFQFAIGIAQEKGTAWSHYLHILPLPKILTFLPKVLNALFVSLLSIAAVVIVAMMTTPLNWQELPWMNFLTSLMLGSVPFALLGACLGYSASAKSIVPLANLVYLPLSFAGGLWMPPQALPKVVQKISEYLPTRFLGEVVWASLLDQSTNSKHIWGLALYAALFLAASLFLFRKTQEQEFR
ncbi:ABC transporter permease [Bdellovibrio bacteriovorus]|uniref:ABC transporter permease n=1 Tax=Bdellovibrio bacteriovorus TaxID=959 RepID=UPI0035A60EA8